MFKLGLIILSITAAKAIACPNLQGKFLCNEQDENGNNIQVVYNVEQNSNNGITTYKLTKNDEVLTLIADGQERMQNEFKVKGSCDSNKYLNITTTGSDSGYIYTSNSQTSLSGSQLITNSVLEVTQNNSVIYKTQDTSICQKL